MATTIKTSVDVEATAPNSSRKLARKSNGDLWCCYVRSDGTRKQIYAAYSQDDGATWTEEQVSEATDSYNQEDPAIAIDSQDSIHVVWSGTGVGAEPDYRNIQYRKRVTSWQTKVDITDGSLTWYQDTPAIAVDSNDYLHLFWASNGGYSTNTYYHIIYRKYTTSWQSTQNVTSGNTLNYNPSIAIDSSNNVHVVWRRGAYSAAGQGIYYRKRTTSWQTEELVQGSGQAVLRPCLAIDSDDNLHCAYYNVDVYDTKDIRYRKRTSSWQDEEIVYRVDGENHTDPTIATKGDSCIHVVWTHEHEDDWNILHSQKTTSWSTPTIVVAGMHPNLIWANHPTVAGTKTNVISVGYCFVYTVKVNSTYDAKHHCGYDAPCGVTEGIGRITGLVHRFSPGHNSLEAVLGGLSTRFAIPKTAKKPLPAVKDEIPVCPPSEVLAWSVAKGYYCIPESDLPPEYWDYL